MTQKINLETIAKSNLDQAMHYQELDAKTIAALNCWVRDKFEPAQRMCGRCNSRCLRNLFRCETGYYISDSDIKDAMLAAGFTPEDTADRHWYFRIKLRIPDSFYGFAYKRYRCIDSAQGSLTRWMESDIQFPKHSNDRQEILDYIIEQFHDCGTAIAFSKIWKSYERTRLRADNSAEGRVL